MELTLKGVALFNHLYYFFILYYHQYKCLHAATRFSVHIYCTSKSVEADCEWPGIQCLTAAAWQLTC